MSPYAPIVLFVFARPEHTRQTLTALAANDLASASDLFIYADAARNEKEDAAVNEVRAIVSAASGFSSVTVIERATNYGLTKNIIEGVTTACERFGKVIVVEDDIVTSPYFLSFMNKALHKYADDRRVWHVSGWNYPISGDDLGDAYFWRIMNCWGWATWSDRWRHYDKNPEKIVKTWSIKDRKRFNVDNAHPFFSQIIGNYIGKNNTWAIFWYATIFANNGLCLTPTQTLVDNVGCDGTGTHGQTSTVFARNVVSTSAVNLPETVVESQPAIERVRQFFHSSTALVQALKNQLKTNTPTWLLDFFVNR